MTTLLLQDAINSCNKRFLSTGKQTFFVIFTYYIYKKQMYIYI